MERGGRAPQGERPPCVPTRPQKGPTSRAREKRRGRGRQSVEAAKRLSEPFTLCDRMRSHSVKGIASPQAREIPTGGTGSHGKHARSGPRREWRRHGPPMGAALAPKGHWSRHHGRAEATPGRRGPRWAGRDGWATTNPTNSAQHRRAAAAGAERQRERRRDAGTRARRRRRRERRRRRAQGRRLRRERPRRRSRPGRGTDRPRTTDDRARPIYRRRPPRGSCEAGRVGGITPRTAGREAQNCAVPEDARRAPQGTDRAPLPPAPISSRIAERSEMGGWGERATRACGGKGGGPAVTAVTGVGPLRLLGALPSPVASDRRLGSAFCT